MSNEQGQATAFEIATLGRNDFDVNSVEKKYLLKSNHARRISGIK